MLIDRWIEAHPEFANVQHTENQPDEEDAHAALDDALGIPAHDDDEPDEIDAQIAEIAGEEAR
jgi:hypothetical protein